MSTEHAVSVLLLKVNAFLDKRDVGEHRGRETDQASHLQDR